MTSRPDQSAAVGSGWRWFGRLLLVALVYGALVFGAAYPWAYWPLMAWCTALGVWGIIWGRSERWRQSSALLAALALTAAGIAVQLVPLPYAWFVRLAPAADRFLRAYQVGYALSPPAWHTLSINAASTLQVLGLFAALAIFLVGLRRAVDHLDLSWLAQRIMLFGVALAVFGVVQKSLSYRGHFVPIYGFWGRSHLGNPFGPFVNRNHFAGWMVLALPVAIACVCTAVEQARHPRDGDWRRWLRWLARPEAGRFQFAAVCVLAMAAALVLTGSRSGVASFAIGLVVMGALTARRIGGRAGRRLGVALAAAFFVGAVAWGGVGRTAERFSPALLSRDVPDRMSAWHDALRIFGDFPVFGVGLGNFGEAMLLYQTAPHDSIFESAHDDYVQVLAEGGLVVALGALWTVFVLARTIRARVAGGDADAAAYWLRAGAIGGVVGMAAQEVVEFSLQLPGITILFVVLLAIAMRRNSAGSTGRQTGGRAAPQ